MPNSPESDPRRPGADAAAHGAPAASPPESREPPSQPPQEPASRSPQQPASQPPPQRDSELDALRAELAQLDDRWKRALADLDNYRKRTAAEIERRAGETRERLLREWLEIVDSLERALGMGQREGADGEGLRAVLQQMEAVLARNGLRRVGAAGEPFDPERHEAIGVRETDDVPDRTVVEVARSGWALGDRVLRPAQVLVARRPASVGQPGAQQVGE
jgi:molecular chaperone GrpE